MAGTLIRSGASGTSRIGLATTDAGTIEAAAGTLDFTSALSGGGGLTIDGGAVLEVDGSVAKTLAASFNGSKATLALASPAAFAATIAGFASTDTIDLLKVAATGASVNGKDQLVIVDGTATVATLKLTGSYSGATFSVGGDGKGGTGITLVTAASVPPPATSPQAMVAAMASLGAATLSASAVTAHSDAVTPMLLAPRSLNTD